MNIMDSFPGKRYLIGLGIIFIVYSLAAFPPFYWAMPMQARVVDTDTGEPIEGAIVVARWILFGGFEGMDVGSMAIIETVTDKNGEFRFSWWGPRFRVPWGRIQDFDPGLIIYKEDYRFRYLTNSLNSSKGYSPIRWSDWDGKTIELKIFEGGMEGYARHLGNLDILFRFIGEQCNWKKVPHILVALGAEEDKLRQAGIIRTFYSPSYLPADKGRCGSISEFFRNYKQ